MISTVTNENNMLMLSRYPTGFFDLAIVDPPYGLNMAKEKPRKDGRFAMNIPKKWDETTPDDAYFKELFRVSKNQIIWGGNYFPLPPCRCFIFWYKQNPVSNFSDGEFAWTSFNQPAKCFDYRYYGNQEGNSTAKKKIHISQKPIALYRWLLQNYAKPGDKILDTHLGSQSSRIAAQMEGFDFYGCELDTEYFNAGNKRYNIHMQQPTLFING